MSDIQHDPLSTLETELDTQITKTRRERRMVILIGMCLWLFVILYFSYFANQLKNMVEPKVIGGYVTGQLCDFMHSISSDYAKTAERMAPVYTAEVSATIIANIPVVRREVQMFILGWFEDRFDDIDGVLCKLLDAVMQDHLEDLKPLIANCSNPEGRKALEAYLASIIAAPLEHPELKSDIENVNVTLNFMVGHLQRLASGTNLTAEDKRERELLIAFREFVNRMP
jgi:hypothetical protein